MRADDVELDEEEREPVDGDELEEGREDNEDEDEEEGMNFWFGRNIWTTRFVNAIFCFIFQFLFAC